ncbi:MAG: hypothetical protein WBA89_23790 [Microcoleus sp.]
MCYEFEISDGIQNPGLNYSVKQKLDRIQPQHKFHRANDFLFATIFKLKA